MKSGLRLSNFELIRVIAMSMIVLLHFYVHGGLDILVPSWYEAFTIYGVDLFVLISGTFLIKANWKSVFRLIFIVIVFTFVSFICYYFATGDLRLGELGLTMLAPMSHGYYWFIQVYFVLLLLSPILNTGLMNLNLNQLRRAIAILSFIEFYSCALMHNIVDNSGYSLYSFIYLYILGYYITQEPLIKVCKGIWIYLLLGGCIIANIILSIYGYNHLRVSYSSPINIAVCVGILLLLSRKSFYSKSINSLGSCALGVYLLQDGILGNWLYKQQISWTANGLLEYLWKSAIVFLSLWIAAYVIMDVTKRLFNVICALDLLKKFDIIKRISE